MQSGEIIGKRIDNFVVEECIGEGGMAIVYRAHQPSMKRDVALKVIELNDTSDKEHHFRERFDQEVSLISSLEHIHILPVYDYGFTNDFAYLAMRLLRGGTLIELIGEKGLHLDRCLIVFSQVMRGLAYAHHKGIIHRDLKPGNIMFDDIGHALLTDFGLAKIVSGPTGPDLTKSEDIIGTPSYMSPEQLRGEPLDHRTDIYSMGIILYQMLTGIQPFIAPNSDVVAVIYRHLEEIPEPPSAHNPGIPSKVDGVVLRALSKNPDDRYDSAGEMTKALFSASGTAISSTEFPLVNVPNVSSNQRKRRTHSSRSSLNPLHILLSIALGAAIVLTSVWMVNDSNSRREQNAGMTSTAYVEQLQMTGTSQAVAREMTSTAWSEITSAKATILIGETGTLQDTVPTEDELMIARARVGDGFIAFVTCNRSSEYHSGYARELVDAFRAYGLQFRIYDSNSDQGRQIPLIERARSDGAVGMIICPLDIGLLSASLQSLEDAAMPLVLTQSGGDSSYGGVMMSIDDYQLGLKSGRFAGQLISAELDGLADVIILDYPDLPYLVQRADGLEDGVLESAPDAKIVGRYLGAVDSFAYNTVSNLLDDGVIFDVVVSINDAGTYGAIQALEEAGFESDQVIIIGIDAEQLAREYIREGNFMRGSVDLDRVTQTLATANSMIKLLSGGTIPEIIVVETGDVVTKEMLLAGEK